MKQYEPAFSPDFGCELPQANGVTPIIFYDAAGRVVRTEMPDGTFSKVEFSPWHGENGTDANDTGEELVLVCRKTHCHSAARAIA